MIRQIILTGLVWGIGGYLFGRFVVGPLFMMCGGN